MSSPIAQLRPRVVDIEIQNEATPSHRPSVSFPSVQWQRPSIARKQTEFLESYPLPKHWQRPDTSGSFGQLQRLYFDSLCLFAFGHAGLAAIWIGIRRDEYEGDDSTWMLMVRQLCDRLGSMVIVAGLLLATVAVFLSTTPPESRILNYTARGPYICLFTSFLLLIGGITVGGCAILIACQAKPIWCERVFFCNRLCVYCTLISLSYTYCTVSVAAGLLVLGITSAAWCGADIGVQMIAGFTATMPFFPMSLVSLLYINAKLTKKDLGAQAAGA